MSKSEKTSIWTQKSALIQPRTSRLKFALFVSILVLFGPKTRMAGRRGRDASPDGTVGEVQRYKAAVGFVCETPFPDGVKP